MKYCIIKLTRRRFAVAEITPGSGQTNLAFASHNALGTRDEMIDSPIRPIIISKPLNHQNSMRLYAYLATRTPLTTELEAMLLEGE